MRSFIQQFRLQLVSWLCAGGLVAILAGIQPPMHSGVILMIRSSPTMMEDRVEIRHPPDLNTFFVMLKSEHMWQRYVLPSLSQKHPELDEVRHREVRFRGKFPGGFHYPTILVQYPTSDPQEFREIFNAIYRGFLNCLGAREWLENHRAELEIKISSWEQEILVLKDSQTADQNEKITDLKTRIEKWRKKVEEIKASINEPTDLGVQFRAMILDNSPPVAGLNRRTNR